MILQFIISVMFHRFSNVYAKHRKTSAHRSLPKKAPLSHLDIIYSLSDLGICCLKWNRLRVSDVAFVRVFSVSGCFLNGKEKSKVVKASTGNFSSKQLWNFLDNRDEKSSCQENFDSHMKTVKVFVTSRSQTIEITNKFRSCFHLRFHSAQMFILKSYASSWRKEKSIKKQQQNAEPIACWCFPTSHSIRLFSVRNQTTDKADHCWIIDVSRLLVFLFN